MNERLNEPEHEHECEFDESDQLTQNDNNCDNYYEYT